MTWNDRVLRRVVRLPDGAEEVTFGIHEVFYNTKGEVTGFTQEPVDVSGDSLEELELVLQHFARALREPVLDYDMKCAPFDTDEDADAGKALPTDNF